MANTLSTLKFVAADQPKSVNAISPVERRRTALIARIDEQVALANAMLEGRRPEFTRTVKDKTTGQKTAKSKTVRAWFWPQGSKYFVTVKYGLNVIKLSPKGNAIEAPSLKGVVTVLTTIKTATQAGELDDAIAAAVTPKRTPKAAKK